MSLLGKAPEVHWGTKGAGARWTVKKFVSTTQRNQAKRNEKYKNLISTTKQDTKTFKESAGGSRTTKQRHRGTGGGPQHDKGGARKSKNHRYTLSYSNTASSNTTKLKTAREAHSAFPAHYTSEGRTSTLFGHSVQPIDNRSTFRAVFQNPNGINPHPGNFQFAMSLSECHANCISLIGLSETNREWNNLAQQKQLREAVHKIWGASIIQTSTSSERFEENYKPGGTATILCEDHWVCRLVEKGEDPWGLGRWSYILLSGKKNRRILSVNGYRVCQSTAASSGETTAYKQQYNILRGRITGVVDPRKQGVMDMQTWLAFFIAQGVEVIFYLDGNENIAGRVGKWCELPSYEIGTHASSTEHDGSLATLITTLGLVDVLQEQHKADIPATYTRGNRRLDYVFVTPQVMACVDRSCMLPFHTAFGGDHRPILIDFDARKLFGDTSFEIQRPQLRGLTLKDPRIVNMYLETLQAQLAYHKIYDKFEALQDLSGEGAWSDSCVIQYEKMDNIITESVKHADRHVAKRYSSAYEWSPDLICSVNAVRYWELRLKQDKRIPVDPETLATYGEGGEISPSQQALLMSRAEIVSHLREAKNTMYDHQRRHVELRRNYLEELAEAAVLDRRPWLDDDGNQQQKEEQTEKQIKLLIKRETIRRMHRTIGSLLKPGRGKGLLQVDIPDDSAIPPPGVTFGDPSDPKSWRGPWISIKDPETMAKLVACANIKSFHQAHPTPFCGEPLGLSLGKYAESPIADKILRGEPIPEPLTADLMDETKRMLTELGKPPPLVVRKDIKLNITMEEFKHMYKKIPEKKSSSPSDKHVGHYKVATKSDALSRLYAGMMSFPYTEGFSPARWRVSMDVMLPKEENNWRISRLRIIQLYESDFNQSARQIFARQLGSILEESNLAPAMQFGSRPGRMSISPVLQKVLTYDIARLAKLVIGSKELDAIGCYDRIAPVLGYLQCRRLGLPHTAIKALADTWSTLVHVIRTAYGRSKSEYRSTLRMPLYGAGQGSTNGPFFWLLMFILVHDSLDPELRTLVFICAWASMFVSRPGDAFVDDSHLGVTSSYVSDPDLPLKDNIRLHELQVIADLTKLAQQYERLLWSTGGALNILKCSWVLISWVWQNGRARLATIEQAPGTIELTSGNDTTTQLVPRVQPSTSYRTLGVHISGDGNQRKAKELLRGHSAVYAGKIGPAQVNSVTAFYAFQLYLSPKLGYSLPVSSFTFKDCAYIQAPALMVTLPKLKINRNTARAIVHGPTKFGGLKMRHLYCEQANGQLRLLLGHLRNRDHTGELILVAMSYLQILVGSTKPFWNLPFSQYARWIENSWLKSIWAFLHRVDFSLDVRLAWTPSMQREGDSTLMSIFIEGGYGNSDLAQLNRCRLYHQVFFISDIASANGKTIDDIYRSTIIHPDRRSSWKWPQQGMPDRPAWRLWARALAYLETRGKLRVALGAWTAASHQTWAWQIHLPSQTVVHTHDGQVKLYSPMVLGGTRGTMQLYSLDASQAPREALRADDRWAAVTPCFSAIGDDIFSIQISGDLLREAPQTDQEPETFASFTEHFQRAPLYYQRLVGPISSLTDGTLAAIRQYIEDGSLLTCSDGSHDPEVGTASHAWLFSDKAGHVLWSGAGPIDGNPDMLTSYRSELGGITTILFLLVQIVDFFEITSGSVRLFCDNAGALDNVFDEFPKRGIYPLLARDYDLLGVARSLLSRLPITVTKEWVKGHYKGDNREIKHDLNDIADYLAEQFQLSPPAGFGARRMPLLHPDFEAVLYFSGSMVTTKFRDIIYSQIFSSDLIANIQKKTGWSPRQFNSISWTAYDAAFRSQSLFRQISVAKLSHDLWNTGAQKLLFGQDIDGLCPVCRSDVETMDHIFQCQHADNVLLKQQLLDIFLDDLGKLGTPRAIKNSLFVGLRWWMLEGGEGACPKAPGFGSIKGSDVWSTNAFADQSSLGWGQVLRGRFSSSWGDAYIKETKSAKPKEAHAQWTKRVIQFSWKLAFAIWENRNGVLHGKTVAQNREIAQEVVHNRLRELYATYAEYPAFIHQSAGYLFEKPLTTMLGKGRQYLLCWIRSVETASAYREQETSNLTKQASRFFSSARQCAATVQAPSPRVRSLRDADIHSPDRYSLRQRGGPNADVFDESDDSVIPPAMFSVPVESSYSFSDASDIAFCADSPLADEEVTQLELDLRQSAPGSTASETSADSSYVDSEASDILLRSARLISSAELAALHSLSGTAVTEGALSGPPVDCHGYSGLSLTPGECALLQQVQVGSSTGSGPVPEGVSPPSSTNAAPLSPPAGQTSLSTSTSETFSPRDLSFPLQLIGALNLPEPPLSCLSDSSDNPAPPESTLTVFGEYCSAALSDLWIPMRQPSHPSSSGMSSSAGQSAVHYLDNSTLHSLVRRAQLWLMSYTPQNRDPELSPSIYWAIRSLRSFHASALESAEHTAVTPMEDFEDEEWPEPPDGADNFDWSGIPNWLAALVNVDNLHEWGLRGIRRRTAPPQGVNSVRFNLLLREAHSEKIPWREQDDPPDLAILGLGTNDSIRGGLIEELSGSDEDCSDSFP